MSRIDVYSQDYKLLSQMFPLLCCVAATCPRLEIRARLIANCERILIANTKLFSSRRKADIGTKQKMIRRQEIEIYEQSFNERSPIEAA